MLAPRFHHRAPRVLLGSALLVGTLALGACGSDDDDDNDPVAGSGDETSMQAPGTGPGDPVDMSPIAYDIELSTEEEIPAPTGADGATGYAQLVFDPTTRGLTGTITTSDLSGPPTMAHVHQQPAGELTGPPIITFLEDGSGTGFVLPDDKLLTEEQAEALQTGLLYLNVHTALNEPGEIRGQLELPEPDENGDMDTDTGADTDGDTNGDTDTDN